MGYNETEVYASVPGLKKDKPNINNYVLLGAGLQSRFSHSSENLFVG